MVTDGQKDQWLQGQMGRGTDKYIFPKTVTLN